VPTSLFDKVASPSFMISYFFSLLQVAVETFSRFSLSGISYFLFLSSWVSAAPFFSEQVGSSTQSFCARAAGSMSQPFESLSATLHVALFQFERSILSGTFLSAFVSLQSSH
jgi:hypothetical protein